MPAVGLSESAENDLEKIFDHLALFDAKNASSRVGEIEQALSMLAANPMIGRPVSPSRRELLIGKRKNGYIATYQYVTGDKLVLVTAIRSQHQAA
ncbi:type II toxin-antitoxin system RelE/ParE family toxin [Duganella levis]|uniref:Type II toxin-antitoxin system RelE/ParE family toxin n=1 Tax=Duganella levis TaxID=2692169 RepID=A0ABW9W5I9_9BURK|nr:type II toxin-antitoxin system RelE/ParE family toxin [Duganella levis]MYN28845.1 type II toxin-antitoxin system RelE/ParE family toxin [Duganella levis]